MTRSCPREAARGEGVHPRLLAVERLALDVHGGDGRRHLGMAQGLQHGGAGAAFLIGPLRPSLAPAGFTVLEAPRVHAPAALWPGSAAGVTVRQTRAGGGR